MRAPLAPEVIGRGGLLGGALVQHFGLAPGRTGVTWDDDELATRQLHALADDIGTSSDGSTRWVIWCAGAGVVGTYRDGLRRESQHLRGFLHALRPYAGRTLLFLASSAGGVYAGSTVVSTELSPPSAVSDYGLEKLYQERLVTTWCRETGGRAVIGRISNLYGPGQNLAKGQGLVSRLVRASMLSEPLTIFVPLDTTRDYFFASDTAAAIGAVMDRAGVFLRPGESLTKLLCSGRLTTIGALVAELARIRKRRPPIVFARSASSALQPRTLAFRSVVWPDVVPNPGTSLPAGLGAIIHGQMRLMARGELR